MNGATSGTVFEVSDEELARADTFEAQYSSANERALASGKDAWVYVHDQGATWVPGGAGKGAPGLLASICINRSRRRWRDRRAVRSRSRCRMPVGLDRCRRDAWAGSDSRELRAITAATSKPYVNFFVHQQPAPDPTRRANGGRSSRHISPSTESIRLHSAGPQRLPFDDAAADVLEEFKPPVVSFHLDCLGCVAETRQGLGLANPLVGDDAR
jgi:hypothetical protein